MVRLVALTPDAMRVQMADEQRRERGSRPAGSSGPRIVRHLEQHAITAKYHSVPGGDDPTDALLSYAADCCADLLVMGGYGHSRFRELLLGGTTRGILASMTLPVFMSH